MGVPTSEVGYTSAMPRREDHEVHKGHVVALGGGIQPLYVSAIIGPYSGQTKSNYDLSSLLKVYSTHLWNRQVSFILTLPSFSYFVLVLPEDDPTMGRNMYRIYVGNVIVLAVHVLLDFAS